MGRAGQRNDRIFAAHCAADRLGEAAVAVLGVQTLAHVDHDLTRGQDRGELLRRRRHGKRRHRQHHQIRVRGARHICRDLNALRDLDARQQLFIGALAVQQITLLLKKGPRGYLMAVFMQQHGQRNAPAAGAQHKNIHFVFSSPSGADCSIVFLLLKENLFSCPRSIRMMLERCMKTTAAAMPNAIAVKTGSR